MSEEKFECPKCSVLVSRGDRFCKNCGADLSEFWQTLPMGSSAEPLPPELGPEAPYEKKLSLIQRFFTLLTKPSDAMRDIASAPDYTGFFVIAGIEFVVIVSGIVMVMQKIQFVGPASAAVSAIYEGFLGFAVILAIILFAAKWLIKSLIVKYACDGGSGWDFKTAASVTGYAYIADIVFGILGIVIGWFLIPTFTVDMTNPQAALANLSSYRAQLTWLRLEFTLPFSLIGLFWKSYLGGLGAHFGTEERCSIGLGFTVFLVLSLLGLLVSFLTNP